MNVREVFKNKKILVASVAVLLIAGGAVGSKVYADNVKAKEQVRIEQQQKEERQLKIDTETAINNLFEKAIINSKDAEKVAIKNDLDSGEITEVKQKYYVENSKDDWQKTINDGILNAENQMKQIETAKSSVEKIFKDNKVVNTDQKNVDSANKEISKIKNAKAKKDLSDKVAKVQEEINKQKKEKEEQEKEAEKQAQSKEIKENDANVSNPTETVLDTNNQQEQIVQEQQPQGQVSYNQAYAEQGTSNNWQAPAETTNNNTQPTTPAVTPPTSGGSQQQPSYPDYPLGEQTGTIPENGGTWNGGWSEVN